MDSHPYNDQIICAFRPRCGEEMSNLYLQTEVRERNKWRPHTELRMNYRPPLYCTFGWVVEQGLSAQGLGGDRAWYKSIKTNKKITSLPSLLWGRFVLIQLLPDTIGRSLALHDGSMQVVLMFSGNSLGTNPDLVRKPSPRLLLQDIQAHVP